MKKGKKYIIMCVGHTHTGKTTLARKLAKEFPNLQIIDNDEISQFLNNHFRVATFSNYNKAKRTYKEPNLKFLVSKDIQEFCFRAGLNIIHSSSNLGKDARSLVIRNAKKYDYSLVTIYFNLPKELILERIKTTKKSTDSLWRSKNWFEVMEKQEGYAELPPSKKDTIYFEIQSDKEYNGVYKEVKGLFLKSGI